MSDGDGRRKAAEAMLLTTTLIWGGTFGATKELLNGGMEPMGLLTWRFGIAVIVFCLIFFRTLRRTLDRRTLLIGAILGVLLYGGFGLQTIGLDHTSSSRSGFITALYVVMTPFLQLLFGRNAPAKRVWISVGIVLAGLWMLTTPAEAASMHFFDGFNIGDLLTLCCALSFALYIVVLDRYGKGLGTIPLTAIQLAVVAVLCGLHFVAAEPWSAPSTPLDWGLMLFLALLASVFTTWCQTNYQPRTTASRAAIIYTMESVFAAVIGIAILGEEMRTLGYFGGVLIIAGLLLVETGPGNASNKGEESDAAPEPERAG